MSSDAAKELEVNNVIKNPADVEDAKAAMKLFSASHEPLDTVKALTVRERILADDPAAWAAAAKILDKEQEQAKLANAAIKPAGDTPLPLKQGDNSDLAPPELGVRSQDRSQFYGLKFFDVQLGFKDGSLIFSEPSAYLSAGRENRIALGSGAGSHEYSDMVNNFAEKQYRQVREYLSTEYHRLKDSRS